MLTQHWNSFCLRATLCPYYLTYPLIDEANSGVCKWVRPLNELPLGVLDVFELALFGSAVFSWQRWSADRDNSGTMLVKLMSLNRTRRASWDLLQTLHIVRYDV